MNLMIVLAVIAIIILAAQYFSQLRKNRNGNNFVSGGRVFFNWTLVAVLVICVGGIIFGSVHSHRQEAKPAQTDKTENVEYAASDSDNLGRVSVQFDRKVTLNDNGEAKVKFKVSPQTTLTIRGHKSKEIVKTFKASKGESLVNHTYTFDVAGTYDIIAERGDQKVTKQLKIKENNNGTIPEYYEQSLTYLHNSFITYRLKKGNCEGIVNLLHIMASMMGLESQTVYCHDNNDLENSSGTNHALLRIKIDNEWCYLDPTYDRKSNIEYFDMDMNTVLGYAALPAIEQKENEEYDNKKYNRKNI